MKNSTSVFARGTCMSLEQKIVAKRKENLTEEVHELCIQLKLYRLRAKKFYTLLKKAKNCCDVFPVVFDMQKTLALPRINVTYALLSSTAVYL